MSQADTQLNNEPETDIDDIADGMDDGEEIEEEEEGEEPDGEEPSDGDDDPEFEVEHGGSKIRLKKSELVAGYMKDADYRRKTTEVAEQRRNIEAASQYVAAERQQYATQLATLVHALRSELVEDQSSLNSLAQTDPVEYVARLQSASNKAQKLQQAEQAMQYLGQQQQQAAAKQQAQFAQEERQTLFEKLPAWRDTKKAQAEQKEIADYLLSTGYTPAELDELQDHRAVLIARDAMLYRRQKGIKDKQNAPPQSKAVRPGSGRTNQSGQKATAAKAAERLSRDPTSLDALASFARERGV